jgi:hypothetical protein
VIVEGAVPAKYRGERLVETPAGGGMKCVAVYLRSSAEKVHPSFPPADRSVTRIELAKGAISPVLAVSRVGGRIEVVNRETDTLLMKLAGFELSAIDFVKPNESLSVAVDSLEVTPAIRIYEINGHHRQAWVVAPSTPYAAITDDKGSFTIRYLPEGKHTLALWSPFAKFTRVLKRGRAEIIIKGGETTELSPIVLSDKDFE